MRAIALAIILAGMGLEAAIRGRNISDAKTPDKVLALVLSLLFLVCLVMGI